MPNPQQLFPPNDATESLDNVSDWALERFQQHYGDMAIAKDDIWEYLYGIMHAPDWRLRYAADLKRHLPRVPLADNFRAFQMAGRELMELHLGYESCPELLSIACVVDGQPDEGRSDSSAYRIARRMRWASKQDRSTLLINDRCLLTNIPAEAHAYRVSGRSPLEWAVDSLQLKQNRNITDDPNNWYIWAEHDNAFQLIRHLRRLAFVGLRSWQIIAAMPASRHNP